MIKVMVSGIQSSKEAMWVLDEKIAYVGLALFREENKDYVKMENAYGILRVLQAAGRENAPKSVAITRNPSVEQIAMIQKFGFDYIQVEGKLEKAAYDTITIPMIRSMDEEHAGALESYLENDKVAAIIWDADYLKKIENSENSAKTEKIKTDGKTLENYIDIMKTHDKLCILSDGMDMEKQKGTIEKLHPDIVEVHVGADADKESVHERICAVKM